MLNCSICESENEVEAVTCVLCGALLVEQFKTRAPDAGIMDSENESLESYLSNSQDSLDMGLHAPSEDLFSGVSGDFLLPSDDSLMGFRMMDEQAPTRDDLTAFSQDFVSESQVAIPAAPKRPPSNPPTPVSVKPPSPTEQQNPWQSMDHTRNAPSVEQPAPATHAIVVYFQRKPAFEFPFSLDKVLVGRVDPATQNYPDLDLTPFDPESAISRKHLYLTQEAGRFYVHPISSAGTQINRKLLAIGNKVEIVEGDVIVLSGRIAMRFVRL